MLLVSRLTAFILLFSLPSFALPFPIGARSWGMGNAVVAVPQQASLFANPAGLGFQQQSFLYVSSHTRFAVAGINTFAAAGHWHHPQVDIGLGIEQFGDKLYNEVQASAGVSKRVGKAAIGLKMSYLQATVQDMAAKGAFVADFGVLTHLTPRWWVGFHAANLLGARLFASQRLPTTYRIGTQYQPLPQVRLALEVQRTTQQPIDVKMGLEYEIIPMLFVRSGLQLEQRSWHGGIGTQQTRWGIDYAVHTSAIGLQHHVMLTYNLPKR